jgi:LmbE family N-acetylglucosaminyl deacetylase
MLMFEEIGSGVAEGLLSVFVRGRSVTAGFGMARLAAAVALCALSVGASSAAPAKTSSSTPGVAVDGKRLLTASGAPMRLLGVDRSGTEYACAQGWGIFDGPSDASFMAAVAAWHVNAVRVPLNEDCWLGINGVDPAYAGVKCQLLIENYVASLNSAGLVAIFDLHWSASGAQLALGQQHMADADHSPTFWASVAAAFKSDHSVMFDLSNEPHDISFCAHPDDESFGLGAILAHLTANHTKLAVLCFTHGEASTLHGVDGDLNVLRAAELQAASDHLGVDRVELLDYPDGALDAQPRRALVDHIRQLAADVDPDWLLVFDDGGITGHPDHQAATDATLEAAAALDLPVIAWAIPAAVASALNSEYGTSFVGRAERDCQFVLEVDRAIQLQAIDCHASQANNNPVMRRRLELQHNLEWLRVLR